MKMSIKNRTLTISDNGVEIYTLEDVENHEISDARRALDYVKKFEEHLSSCAKAILFIMAKNPRRYTFEEINSECQNLLNAKAIEEWHYPDGVFYQIV